MNYTIGDFLIRIKNAYLAHKKSVIHPYSKAGRAIGGILVKEGYLKNIDVKEEDGKKYLMTELMYSSKNGPMRDIKLISKPSSHRFVKRNAVKKTLHEYGMNIVSTNQGIMSAAAADAKGIGGELIAKILK